jgi:hypothetical protein
MVIWYTAYDWYEPLSEPESDRLIAYLESGGRLFFSSQDYLYHHYGEPFATDYLGVFGHLEDLGTTHTWGEPLHPIGWGLGPYTLTYTYTNWSDGVIPLDDAAVALRGQHMEPAMITYGASDWRSAFAAFPFDTLRGDAASVVMEHTVGWLSWLGRSTWLAESRTVVSGSQVALTCTLKNDGWSALESAWLTVTLPAELSLIEGSLSPGLSFDSADRTVSWRGALDQEGTLTLSLSVQVAHPLPISTAIPIPARIGYDDHDMFFDRTLILNVNAADLSASSLSTGVSSSWPHSLMPYTLTVHNAGVQATTATVSATNPGHATFTGTIDSNGIGVGAVTSDTLIWSGPVGPGEQVLLHYNVLLDEAGDYWLRHQAWVSDDQGERWPTETRTRVRYVKSYLPQVFR